ncbi:MAG: hypothetical protein ACI8WB_000436 [Phenylobacterium sp.]|jgi:hypothetical protein
MNTMSNGLIAALVLGAVIIAGLSFYLGRLLMMIKQRQRAQAATKQADITKRNKTLSESIYTIAWAMRDGQCDYSEGCLRIWVLLDHYVEEQVEDRVDDQRQLYPGIFNLYEKIKDMPTHEARKKTSKQQIAKLDQQREAYEAEYKPLIEQNIASLIERFGK